MLQEALLDVQNLSLSFLVVVIIFAILVVILQDTDDDLDD